VPTQPPHHVSSQESQNPHPPSPPIHYSPFTILTKRTQFPPGQQPIAKSYSHETNPIPIYQVSRHPAHTPRLRKTNPITTAARLLPPRPHPHFTKRTQSGYQKMRNEPNFRRNPHSTFYNIQYTIPWPNFSIPSVPPPPIYAKQTQLPPHDPTIHDSLLTIHSFTKTNPIPAPTV